MSTQPTALRLADLWEKHSHGYALPLALTAAELRRLSEIETLYLAAMRGRHAMSEELLEALKTIKENAGNPESVYRIARAAIKAVEENT